MSSSASPAPLPAALPASAPVEASPFPYSEAVYQPDRPNFPLTEHRLAVQGESDASAAARGAEREAHVRELGRQQGALECRAKFEEQLARERSAVVRALTDFARERAVYYQKIEAEAVQLALSIARKVLHREAQVDPALLMGIVRVALEQIEGATGVMLVVAPSQGAGWRSFLAANLRAEEMPQITEEAALDVGQCELRTSMGTAKLGLEVQLKEIEQGLMDLLGARPQQKPQVQEKEKEKEKEKQKP
jgi:flagellar assembly protein FliH